MSKKLKSYKLQATRGSAMVAVLVILVVAILVISTIMQNVLVDSYLSFNSSKSDESYNNAVSAIEEAGVQLIRDFGYDGGTLEARDGNVIISISNISETEKLISVVSKVNDDRYITKLEATATYDVSGVFSISNIEEIVE